MRDNLKLPVETSGFTGNALGRDRLSYLYETSREGGKKIFPLYSKPNSIKLAKTEAF